MEMTPEQTMSYIEIAKSLGLSVERPDEVRNLINAIRYCELRFADPHNTDSAIAEKLGVSIAAITLWKSKRDLIAIASQIVLAIYMNDLSRSDTRRKIFSSMQKYMPDAIENLMKMAAGVPNSAGRLPLPKDQIAAYVAIANTQIGSAFVSNLFVGESGGSGELAHLEMRDKLASKPAAVNLDTPVEGQIAKVPVRVASKELPAPIQQPTVLDD